MKPNFGTITSAAIGVIVVGLIFRYAGDTAIIRDARMGYQGLFSR